MFPIRQYDPEQAKSLLKMADRERLQADSPHNQLEAGWVEGATAYAAQAAAGGVTIKVVTVDPSLYYTPQGPDGGYLSYPMFTETPGAAPPCRASRAITSQTYGPRVSRTKPILATRKPTSSLFDALGETDKAKAQEKWIAVQKLQYERGGSIIFGIGDYVDGYAKRVRGVQTNAGGWVNNSNVSKAWLAA